MLRFYRFLALGLGLSLSAAEVELTTISHTNLSRVLTPVNQILTPAGIQVLLPRLRPQAIALSPDGRFLITSGKSPELIVIDPASGAILQRVSSPSDKDTEAPDRVSTHIITPDKDSQLSYTGLIFSPDGKRIYLSNVNGSIKVFNVGTNITASHTILLPETGNAGRKKEIPAGLAITADGKRLYVALNFSNQLAEIDTVTGKLLRTFDVGFGPFDVALVGNTVFVSNWGGRRPDKDSVTGPAGHGTLVRVDPVRFIASEGSVSVIDLTTGKLRTEILTGLHASALAISPSRNFVVVANAGSDTVSVIDIRTLKIAEQISLKWQPKDYYGASPTALTFDPSGRRLFVCNGTQNAVAIVDFRVGNSKLLGLIPTGCFPGGIAYDRPRNKLHVANIKGFNSGHLTQPGEESKFKSYESLGSVSLISVPVRTELIRHTRQVLSNCRRELIEASQLPARADAKPRPIPERVGEPSPIKHMVYIIKENRTYDQVLGDMPQGNGRKDLCVFGENVTPNQHKISREFVLLDNTYCSGINSAEGHEWADSAFSTDYLERSFAGFPRSYPDGMDDTDVDALAYAPSGFIWDSAIAQGKSLRVYGEFATTEMHWKDKSIKHEPKFLDVWKDFTEKTNRIDIWSRPSIASLTPYLCTNYVGWDMNVPDVWRAEQFIKELKQYEQKGTFPNLVIICLPNNHTSGTASGAPTPAAHVADNDLALGQIVEALTHSPFWKEMCILSIEDDPQDGWDHVSGFRTTAFCISPYAKRKQTVSKFYTQPSLLRTIELVLGLPPLNQFDAGSNPMGDCFMETPDFTPYTAVTNNIPLNQMNPDRKAILDPIQKYYAEASDRLPLKKVDQCDEDVLNRILWFAQKGTTSPYPKWAILPRSMRPDRD